MYVHSSFVHKVSSHGRADAEMHSEHEKAVADRSRRVCYFSRPVFFGNGDLFLRPVPPSDVHREGDSQGGEEEERLRIPDGRDGFELFVERRCFWVREVSGWMPHIFDGVEERACIGRRVACPEQWSSSLYDGPHPNGSSNPR